MKNLFSIKISKSEERYDETGFLSRTIKEVDGDLTRRQSEITDEAEKMNKQFRPYQWIFIAALLIGTLCFVALMEFLSVPFDDEPKTYAEVFARVPWLIIGAAVGLVVCAGTCIFIWLRMRRVQDSPAMKYVEERVEKFLAESREALGVPETAEKCDVLVFPYRVSKSGKVRIANVMLGKTYVNREFHVFREGDALCLADNDTVHKIPFDRMSRLVCINKRISMLGWNKEEKFNKGRYKQYRIRMNGNNNNQYFVKPYLSLQIMGSEEYELLFPGYETETVQRLTGKYAE